MMDINGHLLSFVLVVLYALAWAYTFFRHQKSCSGSFGSGSFILLTYLIFAIAAVFLYASNANMFGKMHLLQFVYLFGLLLIGLLPVLSYDRANITDITPPSEIVIITFSIVYVICTILYIPVSVSHIKDGITAFMADQSAGMDIYNDRLDSWQAENYSISNIFSIIYNIFSDCAILVYFYYLTIPKRKKIILTVLSFAVFSSIFLALVESNRTQATFGVLSITASYFMFRKFYSNKIKKIARITAISLGSIAATLFLFITISRFGDMNDGATDSMLYYTGQAPLYFNKYAFDLGGVRYGDRTINLFKKMLGFDAPTGIFDTRMKYQNMAANDSIFTTYIGDFVLDFGPWLTPILVIWFSVMVFLIIRPNGESIEFHKLIPLHFVMNVCVKGGMYLFCYPFMLNLTIFAYLFFYLCCILYKGSDGAI